MSSSSRSRPWRAIGFWLALLIALLQAFNAVRAFADPQGFAVYLGLPLENAIDGAWVQIYALRTAFIALVVGALLARMDLRALTWVALMGVIMPVGDAALTHQAGAAPAIVARHVAIAIYLLITFAALVLWTRRNPN